jgi:hypothetical protein
VRSHSVPPLFSAAVVRCRGRAMAVRVASETTRQIFVLAAGEGNDARIEKPGISGLVVLLQSQLTDYVITPEDIGAVFVALSLDEDCSFTYDEFETFVNLLFAVESIDDASVSGESERIAADVCSLADTIAARCARNDFPLIAPSELLSPMETGAAETTLSLTEKFEYVQLQSYLASQKANFFLASPMDESTPHAVQEAICQRESKRIEASEIVALVTAPVLDLHRSSAKKDAGIAHRIWEE